MTPEFSGLVNPIIRYTIDVVDRVRAGTAELVETRADLRMMLDRADRQVASPSGSVTESEWTLAKRALVFWLDEVLTIANPQWENVTLEWEYYESRDRAWRYYYDWETQANKSTPNVAELWYLLLVLGFEGDIKDAFNHHLNKPIPAGTTDEAFRKRWVGELARLVPPLEARTFEKIPLRGTIEPLVWDSRLMNAVRWTFVLLLITVVLVMIWYKEG
jgi:hypothetical protein